MLSRSLRAAIKTSHLRQYQLAHLVGVHPATLSAWMNGIYYVSPDDARLRKLGQLVGLGVGVPLVESSLASAAALEANPAKSGDRR